MGELCWTETSFPSKNCNSHSKHETQTPGYARVLFGRPVRSAQGCPLLGGHDKISHLTTGKGTPTLGTVGALLSGFWRRCVCLKAVCMLCVCLRNGKRSNSGDSKKRIGLQSCQIRRQLMFSFAASPLNAQYAQLQKGSYSTVTCLGLNSSSSISSWITLDKSPRLPETSLSHL